MGSGCVAQLVEQSLPIPEFCGSNPVIGKKSFILNICLLSTVCWKDKNKEKEAGNGQFFKKLWPLSNLFLLDVYGGSRNTYCDGLDNKSQMFKPSEL